jgi:hypothetical protein
MESAGSLFDAIFKHVENLQPHPLVATLRLLPNGCGVIFATL